MAEKKELDLSKDSFVANGVTYKNRGKLSLGRFMKFEQYQVELGFGVSFEQLFNKAKDVFEDLEKGKPASAAVKQHNFINRIAQKIDERTHPVLKLCGLFICAEGEDWKTYDEAVEEKKINDWIAEGLDTQSFFTLAFNLVANFIPIYNEVSEGILNEEKKAKKTT